MKKQVHLLIALLLVVSLVVGCSKTEEKETDTTEGSSSETKVVTIKAETRGAEKTRIDNLVAAAEKLNAELKEQGENIEVVVEASAFDGGLDDYRKRFILAYQSKNEPDIYTIGHEDIPWLANAKYILSLDELKDSEAYGDVYDALWDATMWNGHIWGALQDTEARPIFFNVNVLKELGWSEAEIKDLPSRVEKGEFTIDDMTAVAKEAKDKGLVEWGIMHRPTNGPDFHMIAMNFGAQLYDENEDKIVLDKPAVLKTLQYFNDLTAVEKLTPDTITSMEWNNIHQINIDGKALFWYGGIWNIFNYIQQGADYDKMMEQFDFMLVPAAEKGGKPTTLSHPLLYTVSSQTENPDLVKRLLEIVAAPEYQVKHSVETYHLPINKSGAADAEFKKDEFLSSVTYMLDYTSFIPNNQNFNQYSDAFYKAIQGVEIGKMTPEEGVAYMETEMKNNLKDEIIILD